MKRLAAAFAACLLLAPLTSFADPAPIETYGRLPATALVALSPSGERIAFVTVSGTSHRLVVKSLDGTVLDVVELEDATVRTVDWAGEDHVIIRTSLAEYAGIGEWQEYETFRAFVVTLKTKQIFVVFNHAQDVSPAEKGFFGSRNVDGHWYGYFAAEPTQVNTDIGGRRPTNPVSSLSIGQTIHSEATLNLGAKTAATMHAFYRVDLDTGELSQVLIADGSAIGPDSSVGAHGKYDPVSRQWTLYSGAEGRGLVTIDDPFTESALLGQGRKPGTAIFRRLDRADGTLWARSTSDDGAPVSLTNDPAATVLYSADGLAVALRLEGERPHMQFFDAAVDKTVGSVTEAFQPKSVELVSASADFNRLVVKSSGADDAGTYHLVDVKARKVQSIGKSYPDLGTGQIAATRIVNYKAADGMALDGILTVPPGAEVKNRPLVVLPHDGPEQRDHLGFDWLPQAFASRGYVVFQPNYRGSSGYGLGFRNAGFGELGRKMQTDISDGVAELARQGIADPKRTCIIGIGYGGYDALAGVTVQHGLYRCAVSVGGVTDLHGLLDWGLGRYGVLGAELRKLERRLGASSEADSAIDAYSPAAQAASADAPILLIYGKNDTVVPTSQSETMARALARAGKPVQSIVLKDEDHWLSHETTRIQMLKETVAFVEKNNPVNK